LNCRAVRSVLDGSAGEIEVASERSGRWSLRIDALRLVKRQYQDCRI
jgi:hypothetical protein